MELKVKSFLTSESTGEIDDEINKFIKENNIQEIKSITKISVKSEAHHEYKYEDILIHTTILYVQH